MMMMSSSSMGKWAYCVPLSRMWVCSVHNVVYYLSMQITHTNHCLLQFVHFRFHFLSILGFVASLFFCQCKLFLERSSTDVETEKRIFFRVGRKKLAG